MHLVQLTPAASTLLLTAIYADCIETETFTSESEALDARDEHYDEGAHTVRIVGLSSWVGTNTCGDDDELDIVIS